MLLFGGGDGMICGVQLWRSTAAEQQRSAGSVLGVFPSPDIYEQMSKRMRRTLYAQRVHLITPGVYFKMNADMSSLTNGVCL